MPSILFISTADQVRGPLAVALLSQMAQPAWGWHISSAGLQAAAGGQPVNRLVWRAMHARGLDHFLQPSRPVTPQVLKAADLILVMERVHRLWLEFGFFDWAGTVAMNHLTWTVITQYTLFSQCYLYYDAPVMAIQTLDMAFTEVSGPWFDQSSTTRRMDARVSPYS